MSLIFFKLSMEHSARGSRSELSSGLCIFQPLLSLSFQTAQEIGHDNRAGETDEAGTNSSSSGRYPDDDSPASSPLPAGTQQQPEKKQQERRKKAAMFLSRLKRGGAGGGSKEEEGPAQLVYGKQGGVAHV